METNMNVASDKEMYKAAQVLLKAAYNFWKIHQKQCGPRAVVWLQNQEDGFFLFTRGEYKTQIIQNLSPIVEDQPLTEDMFIEKD